MSANVIIFEGLLRQLPDLYLLTENLGLTVTPVTDGKEVIPKVQKMAPRFVVLDAFMPGFSGVELCRQIKDSDWGSTTKVVLVAEQISEVLRNRALDLGCDLFSLRSDAVQLVGNFLKENLTASPSPPPSTLPPPTPDPMPLSEPSVPEAQVTPEEFVDERRFEPRIEINGEVSYVVGSQEFRGDLVNGSRSGVLFSAVAEIPAQTNLALKFYGTSGTPFQLDAVVVRSAKMKRPMQDRHFAIGAKFVNVTTNQQPMIDALLQHLDLVERGIDPPTLNSIFTASTEKLWNAFRQPERFPEWSSFLGSLTAMEERAFTSEEQGSNVFRRMVFLRVQCAAFTLFIPRLEKEKKTLSSVFVPKLNELMLQIAAVETELDEAVRHAVASGQEELRRSLNETSNRLHEVKVRLMFSVDHVIAPEGLAPSDQTVIAGIRAKVAELYSLRRGGTATVKFDRRPEVKPEPEKEEKKKKESSVGLKVAVIVVSMLFLGGSLWWQFGRAGSRVRITISMPYEKALISENGVTITVKKQDWQKMDDKARNKVFDEISVFLESKRSPQALITTDTGTRLAAIASAQVGRKRKYLPRVFVK
jgi:CheY-like chemotaxis protein